MSTAMKIAISMSDKEFQEIEILRKEEGLSRSRFIIGAVKLFKEWKEKETLIKIYEEGYKRIPESLESTDGWERASLGALIHLEGDW